jgi:transcriptional regulator with XRE-family HTH domain
MSRTTTLHLGMRLLSARKAAKLSQGELARRSGLSIATISKLERGVTRHPRHDTYVILAPILGVSISYLTGDDQGGSPLTLVAPVSSPRMEVRAGGESMARVEAIHRAGGATLLPVFKWGSAGDPRDRDASPYPDHEEYPPAGKESLVGPRGFGVVIRGESMAARGLNDGDTVWVNPDRSYREGSVVVARVWYDDGSDGMVVKTYSNSKGLSLVPGNGLHESKPVRFDVIGPVVVAARYFTPG